MASRVWVLPIVLINCMALPACHAQLQVGFYSATCPRAELLVQSVVQNAFFQDPTVAPGVLRMHFHDCFVEGCDASVLLNGPGTEKQAIPNLTLHGFDVIDAAKSQVEAACPGIVSCADILAFAARDSVVLTGGPSWNVPAGRKDGLVSLESEALTNIPSPFDDVDTLTQMFAVKQLSQDDMITLSGAHTIGVAHCSSFSSRLYNFSATSPVDPSLDPLFAGSLQQLCPNANANPTTVVSLDSITPTRFDNAYYSDLRSGRGLLNSDEVLFTDTTTQGAVIQNSILGLNWQTKFTNSIIKMSLIGVKTGAEGEIRNNCGAVNS